MSDFRIEIETVLKGNPTSELDALQVAIKDALGSYAQMEKQLARTTKQLASTRDQIGNVREQLAEAQAEGDATGAARLEARLARLVARESKLVAAAGEARAALSNQEDEVRKMAEALKAMRDAEDAAAQAADDNAQGQRDLKAGLKGLGGPLGNTISFVEDMQDAWSGLVQQMGGPGMAALGMAAAGMAALGVATVAAAVSFTKFAVAQANMARDAQLSLQAIVGTEDGAKRLTRSFREITAATGATSGRLAELTKELKEAGVASKAIPAALKAIAMQEAAIGTDGTAELIEALKDGKKSIGDITSEIDKKFGEIAKKRVMGLDQQAVILQEHFDSLFDGINIEPILEGFARLVELLNSNTESGRAIKTVFEAMFEPLGGAEAIFIGIERFLLGMEIAAMRLSIGFKRVAKEMGFDTSALMNIVDLSNVGALAVYAVASAFIGLGVIIGGIVGIVTFVADVVSKSIQGWIYIFEIVGGAISSAVDGIVGTLDGIIAWFEGVDLMQMGSDMIDGLINGIKSGATAVVEAMSGIVDAAVDAAISALKIGSPSKVMEEIGGWTAEGFTVGVDDGAADAQAAMTSMVAPPDPAVAGMTGGKGGALDFTGATFVFHGVADAEQATVRFEEMLVGLLEGQLLQAGSAA